MCTDIHCHSRASTRRARLMRKARPLTLAALAVIAMIPYSALATNDESSGSIDDIKAVFVYKFTAYVTWPDDGSKPFTIAVLGDNSMLAPLKAIAEKKTVDTRRLVIRECKKIDEIAGSQILLISDSMDGRLDAILKKAEAEKMLTIGSDPGLAKKGTAIDFFVSDNRVGFEMNLSAVKRSGLSVSSQLVKLATLVEEEEQAHAGKQTNEEGRPE